MYCFSPTGVYLFFARSCREGTGFSGRLMPAGHLLFYLRFPPCASAIRASPMALGCCVGCTTKKGDKKVAGNAIPRSRLPSERKIAHSRAGSLYPYFGYKCKTPEKGVFNPMFFSFCDSEESPAFAVPPGTPTGSLPRWSGCKADK